MESIGERGKYSLQMSANRKEDGFYLPLELLVNVPTSYRSHRYSRYTTTRVTISIRLSVESFLSMFFYCKQIPELSVTITILYKRKCVASNTAYN